ncbi:MAG: phage major capsid protein, partial [Christensenellales bacterium]
NGTGKLANVTAIDSTYLVVDSVKNLMEGQIVDLYKTGNSVSSLTGRITKIDRSAKKVYLNVTNSIVIGEEETYYIAMQNSLNQEITGIGALFDENITSLYGVTKADYNWMNPVSKTASDGALSEDLMQNCIDDIDEIGGSVVDYITCSNDVRRLYQKLLTATRSNIDVMDLQGGFKALSYNGIPVVADRFVEDGTMYLLSTKDFELHQLCDWRWLEDEGGKIIRQKPGYPAYTATLVKYADLICSKPCGQAKISGITK